MPTEAEKRLWKERGARLIKAREAAGYKKGSPAARDLDIPIGTYNGYENGSRNLAPQAERLAAFFNVSETWLVDGKEDDLLERLFKRIKGIDDPQQQAVAAAAAAALGAIEAVTKR